MKFIIEYKSKNNGVWTNACFLPFKSEDSAKLAIEAEMSSFECRVVKI